MVNSQHVDPCHITMENHGCGGPNHLTDRWTGVPKIQPVYTKSASGIGLTRTRTRTHISHKICSFKYALLDLATAHLHPSQMYVDAKNWHGLIKILM